MDTEPVAETVIPGSFKRGTTIEQPPEISNALGGKPRRKLPGIASLKIIAWTPPPFSNRGGAPALQFC
jgi:hypothetical protein